MDQELSKQLTKIANTVRELSMEAVQKANSGHPGLPMGCAEFGAYLYGCLLRHNPKNPQWLGQDRFKISAGHGSMLLYSLLHLAGGPRARGGSGRGGRRRAGAPGRPEARI